MINVNFKAVANKSQENDISQSASSTGSENEACVICLNNFMVMMGLIFIINSIALKPLLCKPCNYNFRHQKCALILSVLGPSLYVKI